jgi:nitroreductase
MQNNIFVERVVIIIVFFTFCINAIIPVLGASNIDIVKGINNHGNNDLLLPPPKHVNMILEEAIFRRCSIREFYDEPISIEAISTILWNAYGYRDDGSRNIKCFNEDPGVNIYVLIKNETTKLDVFRYNPDLHILNFYKKINSFSFGQYRAPLYLGLVWDQDKSDNEWYVGAEIGEIGQNIAFIANSLDLGSVINADIGSYAFMNRIELLPSEIPRILVPIGYPEFDYNFKYRPLDFSFLPKIKYSDAALSNVIKSRSEEESFSGKLSLHEQYQMIWSTYGFSYLLDKAKSEFFYHITRHRTVPSAHGYYPLDVYAFTEKGVYLYYPNIVLGFIGNPEIDFSGIPIISLMKKTADDDFRKELAEACDKQAIESAPLSIVIILDLEKTRPAGGDDFSGEDFRWIWYYEAGASAINVLLEATAWSLSANVYNILDNSLICSILDLDETVFKSIYAIPVGK